MHALHLLFVDQECQNWTNILVSIVRFSLLLHGVIMGRLRIFDQFDPNACLCFDGHWKIHASSLCRLLHCLLLRHYFKHADCICGISTRPDFGTYVGKTFFFVGK